MTGAFRPGVLTALMGASGAGKTTFMDVLAGRKTSAPPLQASPPAPPCVRACGWRACIANLTGSKVIANIQSCSRFLYVPGMRLYVL